MKHLNLVLALAASAFTAFSCASAPDSTTAEKAINDQKQATTNSSKAAEEMAQISELAAKEFNEAVSKYGQEKYTELTPNLSVLNNAFLSNPCQQTKQELLSFLKANNLFAIIQKPVPKDIYKSAFEKKIILGGYAGVETDYDKIEAHYDAIIKGESAQPTMNYVITPTPSS